MSVRPREAGASGSVERSRWVTFAVAAGVASVISIRQPQIRKRPLAMTVPEVATPV
jgi:hypothetical protein